MPVGKNILIVEDQPEVAAVLCAYFEKEGFYCQRASDGEEALARVRERAPDIVLLDRMLPRLSGDEVARRLKADARTRTIPIIMLTGKADETDQIVGFALGADDYLAKPFSPRVLHARVLAHLRYRQALEPREETAVANVTLDRHQPRVFVDKTAVALTATEYKILATLMAARGHVLDGERLGNVVFGTTGPDEMQRLAGQVGGLQRKMGAAGSCIHVLADGDYAWCPPTAGRA
jgi:two-component system, OmpR family, phosphate regulon response regulator PhoB